MKPRINSPKNSTEYGKEIEGLSTKINQVNGSIKSIILEGKINKIKVDEFDGWGIVTASLNDDTGRATVRMVVKGNEEFRSFVSCVIENKIYRVKGWINEGLDMVAISICKIE